MMLQTVIDHTRDSCLRLALVQDRCYGRTRRIIRVLLASLPIAAGLFLGPDTMWGILLLVLGVMFYYFTSYMYERDAERAFRLTPEAYRSVRYVFREDGFTVEAGDKKRDVLYGEICLLADDGSYYYLFINPQQAYMMELCQADRTRAADWEAFLTEKTGKRWKAVTAQEPFFHAVQKKLRR